MMNKNDTKQKPYIMFTGEQNQFYIDAVILSTCIIQKKQTKRKLKISYTLMCKLEIYNVYRYIVTCSSS